MSEREPRTGLSSEFPEYRSDAWRLIVLAAASFVFGVLIAAAVLI